MKPLHIQTFVHELADEAFHGTVLPKLAWLDKRGVNAGGRQPSLDCLGHNLGPIVTAKIAGHAVDVDKTLENSNHLGRVNSAPSLKRSTQDRGFSRFSCRSYHHFAPLESAIPAAPEDIAVMANLRAHMVVRNSEMSEPAPHWTHNPSSLGR
jgi:hypothetical protein